MFVCFFQKKGTNSVKEERNEVSHAYHSELKMLGFDPNAETEDDFYLQVKRNCIAVSRKPFSIFNQLLKGASVKLKGYRLDLVYSSI